MGQDHSEDLLQEFKCHEPPPIQKTSSITPSTEPLPSSSGSALNERQISGVQTLQAHDSSLLFQSQAPVYLTYPTSFPQVVSGRSVLKSSLQEIQPESILFSTKSRVMSISAEFGRITKEDRGLDE